MHRARVDGEAVNAWRAYALALGLALVGAWSACAARSTAITLPSGALAPTREDTAGHMAPSRGRSRPANDEERRIVRALMRETERIRGLRFVSPVDIHVDDPTAMRAYVASALEQNELARIRLRYVALGLLDANLDVRSLIESLMEQELVGYYDPHTQRLVIRDDVALAFAHDPDTEPNLEWRATVVHELVHALQDQHLQLGKALEQERTTDADNAFGALVEGDATLAMLAYASGLAGVSLDSLVNDRASLVSTLHTPSEALTGAMLHAPPIVRDPLLFRYREGALFAAALVRQGGFGAVDAAHRSPPITTLEILEPQRYLRRDAPVALSLPGLPTLGASGHVILDEDALGRFELGVYLRDQALADDWLADRYVVLKRAEHVGVFWLVRFGTAHHAKRAEQAARRLYGSTEATRIERAGAYLAVLRHVDRAVHAALLRETARLAEKP